MEEAPSKHRNLQHLLSEGVKERAFQMLGYGSEAGLKVLELRQRDMQELFGKIFGVPTKSSNNEWLRSKLLQAVGLPPRWRPAPLPPPSPPREARPGEFSRFGRRLRTTVSPAMTAVDEAGDSDAERSDNEAEQRTRKRPRAARPGGSAGSASSSARSGSPPAVSTDVSSGASAAITALQARAALAAGSTPASQAQQVVLPTTWEARLALQHYSQQQQPSPLAAQPFSQQQKPMPLVPQPFSLQQQPAQLATQSFSQQQQPMPLVPQRSSQQQQPAPLATQQFLQQQAAVPLAGPWAGPAGPVRSVSVPVPPQCAPGRSGALAALLSDPSPAPHSPSLLPSGPLLPSLLALPSLRLTSGNLPSCTISAQLHTLYTDWEDGLVSFGPL